VASTDAVEVPNTRAVDQIVADAQAVPAHSAALRFAASGLVVEVLVQEGDTVEKTAPLARLDTRDLTLNVERAQLALDRAQVAYEAIRSGAPDAAGAVSAGTSSSSVGVTAQDIAAAQARLAEAQAHLKVLERGALPAEIQSARTTLDLARSNLETQHNTLSVAKTNAELDMQLAANVVRDRQAAYSNILSKPQKDRNQQAQDEAAALRAIDDAQTNLQKARVAYEQARQAEITGVQAAQAQVRAAEAQLKQLLAGADEAQIAGAHTQVADAEANLAALDQAQQGQVARIASTAAQVKEAEIALKSAELALDRATLRAPMAGTVAEINLRVGEIAEPAKTAIIVADFSQWRLEATGLTDLEVAAIHEGDPATITFDAIPDLMLQGKVAHIKAVDVLKPADAQARADAFPETTYTVIMIPDRWDQRIRWKMTASIAILPGQ
jgi:HlyD family secretion protein